MQATASEKPVTAALPAGPGSRPLIPEKHRTKVRNNIKGKLKLALDLMVFGPEEGDAAGEAMSFIEAARKVDFSPQAMRLALEKPHVRAYLKAQKEVFRASASAQNISVLVKLRDKSGNGMVQLGAVKTLEQMGDEIGAAGAAPQARPGLVIVVVGGASVEQTLNSPPRVLDLQANVHESTPFSGEHSSDED